MSKQHKKLHRSTTDRILFGVCGGIGEGYDVDPVLVRLFFVLLTFANGLGILAYIILALIMPKAHDTTSPGMDKAKEFAHDVQDRASELVGTVRGKQWSKKSRSFLGVMIVIIGAVLLLDSIFPFYIFFSEFLWPILIIGIGAYLIYHH